ncbi:hypothetical protein FNV43_RR17892 [Rhamnella rubrinervis]|uniref:CRM domain-containing protein n=1 Tax=Rhamnella rubrinervis TaxID=2594499 RepID=A0A8K0GV88_9ROSA|nr:hypothetical protein FNV43_RR17892 [Rhamnella rubrinervis]
MALSPFPLNPSASSSSCSFSTYLSNSHSQSLHLFLLQLHPHCSITCTASKFRISCSNRSVQVDTQKLPAPPVKVAFQTTKKKRKPKPSFFHQIQDKWSMKIASPRQKFPWQQEVTRLQEQQDDEEEAVEEKRTQHSSGVYVSEVQVEVDGREIVRDPLRFDLPRRLISAPWSHGTKPFEPQLDSEPGTSQHSGLLAQNCNGFGKRCGNHITSSVDEKAKIFEGVDRTCEFHREFDTKSDVISNRKWKPEEKTMSMDANTPVSSGVKSSDFDSSDSVGLLSKRGAKSDSLEGENERMSRSNTELAERMLPQHELQRLRNVSLRMLERTKVGVRGITKELVETIHDKWKLDEVIKLKFEEPLSINMKRTHDILESKTGGLVIWRSGSSVVLYRGMTYNLPCVKSYAEKNHVNKNSLPDSENVACDAMRSIGVKDADESTEPFISYSEEHSKDLSNGEVVDFNDLNLLLDELGPRFEDWLGREPLPVDADLLPAVVPDYKTPFRLLPYGVRHCLSDKEMTRFRRLARTVPPHFALGRNRELQGLAKAMVKLWEKSAIAKIAIKRGVQNTRNERMAEELKKLTGGTILSRNKEFIVFYRGNDFLPPVVTKTLKERRNLRDLQQDEEEQARQMASAFIELKPKASSGQLVAGTLAETMAATARWGNQLSSADVEELTRDSTLARHASLVRHLQKKFAIAKGKLKKAERALAQVQDNLEPTELPNDLETLSDEERFLFRKIGLSMKPYLLLGRREVYDGTIENMHLHWKHRELVKIIVKGKSFEQVKHIGISLEAESGGVLVSLDKTTKGYAIIVYRGKNYLSPLKIRPRNLLTRRQALARSIELQRREALRHHISDLQERIELLKSEPELKNRKMNNEEGNLQSIMDDSSLLNDNDDDEGEEAYLEVYDSGNEDNCNEYED